MEYKDTFASSRDYSIDTIIKKYDNVIRKFIINMNYNNGSILSEDDIDDVIQNIYCKLMSGALEKYRGECSLKNYVLYYVARSVYIDSVKEKTKYVNVLHIQKVKQDQDDDDSGEYEIHDDRDNPETSLLKDELEEIIFKELDNLSKKEKLIFIMIEYDGLTQKQVAHTLRISQPTVSEHYNNAKIKLQKLLKAKHPNYVDSYYEK